MGWCFSLCNATTDVQLEPPPLHDDEAPTALAGFHNPLPAFSGVSPRCDFAFRHLTPTLRFALYQN